jgi:curved DNA-binding protein CbpA
VDFDIEIQILRNRLEKGKALSHFQILGLSDKADGAAVKTAYFKLAKLYHPDTVPQDAPPELADLRAQAFSVVGEASRVLGDDQSRADYLESIKAGGGNAMDVRRRGHLPQGRGLHQGPALRRVSESPRRRHHPQPPRG